MPSINTYVFYLLTTWSKLKNPEMTGHQ